MNKLVAKTFGGLTTQYYIRQFLFGLIFTAIFIFMMLEKAPPVAVIGLVIINTFLYPYSRFVYESVVDYIMGDNVFWVNAIMLLIVKFITMAICWHFALFIAPVGLAYLYYHHTKQEQLQH